MIIVGRQDGVKDNKFNFESIEVEMFMCLICRDMWVCYLVEIFGLEIQKLLVIKIM